MILCGLAELEIPNYNFYYTYNQCYSAKVCQPSAQGDSYNFNFFPHQFTCGASYKLTILFPLMILNL